MSAVFRVPVEVRACAIAVGVAQLAPAHAIGAVGVLDAGVAAQATVVVVVLEVHAFAGAGCEAILIAGAGILVLAGGLHAKQQ